MKKLIITSKLLLIGLSVVFAQETLSLKKFNYGLDLSLITHPINVFDKTVTQYGIRPSVYYNLNQHFFLQTGIGVENCKYENFEKYELNGNVGIGTSDPTAKLEIKATNNSHLLKLVKGESTKFVITGDGNVSIGIDNPDPLYSLDLLGEARFKGNVKVCNTVFADEFIATNPTWCDFVFEPEYKLMQLTDLERFIKLNKHLPDIPQAKIVEKEGLSLKEMNQLMMQKIEELTLYIIELNKRIEELENKN